MTLLSPDAQRLRPPTDEVLGHLRRFLAGVDEAALAVVEREVEWVLAPAGTLLMRQGDPGDCLWVVVSGRVHVVTDRPDGREARVGDVGPGESLGEMALLSSEPRSATARTAEDTALLRLSQRAFDRLLAEHPATLAVFTRIMVERLNQRIRARALVTELRARPLVTLAECQEVVTTENLVLRNLRITQMYHRLSLELTTLVGHEDANWCTFACNASKTAGYSIRGEELPLAGLLQRAQRVPALARLGNRAMATSLGERVEASLAEVSRHVSGGNLMVFEELAPAFAELTRTFCEEQEPDPARLAAFLERFDPRPTLQGGQQTLREALTAYWEAIFEADPKRRAERVLLGNLLVGLHEQIRLQPHIEGAMNAPLEVALAPVLGRRFGREAEAALGVLAAQWRRRLTRNLMTLRLPYGVLRLGADVPPTPKRQMYPDLLTELEDPRLVAFAQRYQRQGRRSRAADWAELDDRMSFVLELFRTRQKSLELFDQPFLSTQRSEIALGRVPVGRL